MLLVNRMRRSLKKWGYAANDVKVLFEYVVIWLNYKPSSGRERLLRAASVALTFLIFSQKPSLCHSKLGSLLDPFGFYLLGAVLHGNPKLKKGPKIRELHPYLPRIRMRMVAWI